MLGAVREVHAWSNRPIWPQGVVWPEQGDPIPEGLDWDLWLGPAADRPYYKEVHPFKWRGFWDFGTGAFGDMGCHILNWPFTALDLGLPISAECLVSEGATKDSPPKKSEIKLEFPARGDRPPVLSSGTTAGLLPSAEHFGGAIPAKQEDKKPDDAKKNEQPKRRRMARSSSAKRRPFTTITTRVVRACCRMRKWRTSLCRRKLCRARLGTTRNGWRPAKAAQKRARTSSKKPVRSPRWC
jgi:hypothetical protein